MAVKIEIDSKSHILALIIEKYGQGTHYISKSHIFFCDWDLNLGRK